MSKIYIASWDYDSALEHIMGALRKETDEAKVIWRTFKIINFPAERLSIDLLDKKKIPHKLTGESTKQDLAVFVTVT